MPGKVKIGLISIGLSPREDLVQELRPALGDGVEMLQRGALDGLSAGEVANLKPDPDDMPLITKFDERSSVVLGKRKILPLMQSHIDALEQQGVEISAILCTGEFAELSARKILILPSRILLNMVRSILQSGRLCVVVPLEEQTDIVRARWQTETGLSVFSVFASPYKDPTEMEPISYRIKKDNPDLIVLDCMGYTLNHKKYVHAITGKPVLLPRSLLLQVMKELLCI